MHQGYLQSPGQSHTITWLRCNGLYIMIHIRLLVVARQLFGSRQLAKQRDQIQMMATMVMQRMGPRTTTLTSRYSIAWK